MSDEHYFNAFFGKWSIMQHIPGVFIGKSTDLHHYIFRRPLDARGVSRDTPRMYGQTLKKKMIDEKDAKKDVKKDAKKDTKKEAKKDTNKSCEKRRKKKTQKIRRKNANKDVKKDAKMLENK